MKLLVVDENSKIYEIKDNTCFNDMDQEIIVGLYKELFFYISIVKSLKDLVKQGVIEQVGGGSEPLGNLNYSLKWFKNYIIERFGGDVFNQVDLDCKNMWR